MPEPWLAWPDRDAMAAEYLAGATIRGLASNHHHKYATLGRWLRNVGIIRRQGPQPKTLSSIEGADKGKTAGILADYRRGTPVCTIRATYKVGSAVLYRITDRAGLPRREQRTKAAIQQKRVSPVFGAHDIPAAEKLARMRASATWRAFFAFCLEGHGPAYALHFIHTIRRQQTGGQEEEHFDDASRHARLPD